MRLMPIYMDEGVTPSKTGMAQSIRHMGMSGMGMGLPDSPGRHANDWEEK